MPHPIDIDTFERLKASGDLPSPRGVALAIIRLTQQSEVSIGELARVISGDPAIVGRVVKAANGLIGFNRRSVVSVQEALMVLGLPAVRSMALGFSLLSDYRNGRCKSFDYNQYWGYSLALALGLQAFTQRTRAAAPDEMFSFGLLLRVGELALATIYPDGYSGVLDGLSEDGEATLLELEKDAFAMTHADLGAAMLADWGFPRVFVELIEFYERPEVAGYDEGGRHHVLLESLQCARCFADLCVAEPSVRPWLLARLMEQAARLDLNREEVLADCARMYKLWGEWGELLQVDMLSAEPFPELPPEPTDETDKLADALRNAFGVASERGGSIVRNDRGTQADGPISRPIRILVIERDEGVRDRIASMLQSDDVELVLVPDQESGLDRAIEFQPRMMVLGCLISGCGSLALIQSLRRLRLGRPVHLLLLTDGDNEELMVEALEAGVDDFVPRTASSRALAARLHAGLREVRLRQEIERDRQELSHYASELAVKNRQLQEVALTDTLTGFRNRRYALDRIEQEWAAAKREGRALSCMVLDLDGLKDINDTFGHDAGDNALKQAAEALRKVLRGQDVICRTGGDEFLAICPGSSLAAALACAERLRRSVSTMGFEIEGRAVPVSVSIGVAEKDRQVVDVDALMKLADRGAYLAKERGRDRVAAVQLDSA